MVYVHSKCCNRHWELAYSAGKWMLQCESCGQSIGGIEVIGPIISEAKCAMCGDDCKCGNGVPN